MKDIIDGIDISNFLKGREVFERFRKHLKTEQEKAGAIQAFEFSFELAWKTMKRVLEKRGIDVRSPRDCFREAALNKLITDPELWFLFIEKRNLSVHTYKEENVESIIQIFDKFSFALDEFVKNLGYSM